MKILAQIHLMYLQNWEAGLLPFVSYDDKYRKVVSSNMSHLEAHECLFMLLMKGIFDLYVL